MLHGNEDLIQEDEIEYESLDEVDYFDFLEYSKDELAKALIKCIQCEQDYLCKIKSLNKVISNLCLEKECLEKSKDEDYIKLGPLK